MDVKCLGVNLNTLIIQTHFKSSWVLNFSKQCKMPTLSNKQRNKQTCFSKKGYALYLPFLFMSTRGYTSLMALLHCAPQLMASESCNTAPNAANNSCLCTPASMQPVHFNMAEIKGDNKVSTIQPVHMAEIRGDNKVSTIQPVHFNMTEIRGDNKVSTIQPVHFNVAETRGDKCLP